MRLRCRIGVAVLIVVVALVAVLSVLVGREPRRLYANVWAQTLLRRHSENPPGNPLQNLRCFSLRDEMRAPIFLARMALQFLALQFLAFSFREQVPSCPISHACNAMRVGDRARACVEFEYRKERRNLLVIKVIAIAAFAAMSAPSFAQSYDPSAGSGNIVPGPKGGMQSGASPRAHYNYSPLPRSHHFRTGRARTRQY